MTLNQPKTTTRGSRCFSSLFHISLRLHAWTECFSLDLIENSQLISVFLPPQQPLTAWWGHGVPGHLAPLHVALVAQRGVARYLSPLETGVRPVLTSNSAEVALETTPYATLRKVRTFSVCRYIHALMPACSTALIFIHLVRLISLGASCRHREAAHLV